MLRSQRYSSTFILLTPGLLANVVLDNTLAPDVTGKMKGIASHRYIAARGVTSGDRGLPACFNLTTVHGQKTSSSSPEHWPAGKTLRGGGNRVRQQTRRT